MPIDCKFPVHPINQDAFHAIDKVVMGHAFDIHNELGRFCDERIYQQELAHRCMGSGLNILCEPMISVTNQDFRKQYFLDILAAEGAVYEMKAVKCLNGQNEMQGINYLLLAGLNHGKLINMRPGSVEARFISTQLTPDTRRRYFINLDGWKSSDPKASRLHDTLAELLNDWGAFLDMHLYREAIIHFFGGDDQVIRPVDIQIEGRVIGKQKVSLLGDDTAFHLSAIKEHHKTYQKHMVRLLSHSSLRQIHWINFQGAHIQFKTLEKK
jgi:GxxExxY protein